jgi:hypothetical protein
MLHTLVPLYTRYTPAARWFAALMEARRALSADTARLPLPEVDVDEEEAVIDAA